MKVGFIGLGKLGLPVALAAEKAGHEIAGYDTSLAVVDVLLKRELPYLEEGAQELLDETRIEIVDPALLSQWADIIFIAVQTPHESQYEGITRLPETRADFDYSFLRDAVDSVLKHDPSGPVVVISTVLPRTLEELGFAEAVLYNPFFIAMGTTIADFRAPEFVLVGTDGVHPGPLREFYAPIHSRPMFVTTIKTAELTKVAYNTFIGLKIAFANTIMELSEKVGADCDDVIDALSLAKDRIISPAYLRGGMGDGGGCHPRDNIALSWLAREVGLSYDLFEALMECREKQTEWLAHLAVLADNQEGLTVLGKAYKPETNLTVGSPAMLLGELLDELGVEFEHEDSHV